MKLTLDQMMEKAALIAARAHHGAVRLDGTPYFCHPVIVAIKCENKLQGTIALLHDVVEDTEWTIDMLREEGFTDEVLLPLEAVTKRKGERYDDFITRVIEGGYNAMVVKLADIDHNMEDQSALDPDDAEYKRGKYEPARERLIKELEKVEGWSRDS
jgi:(p)ppGpp synthase/HD superfamily hydrolase